MRAAEDPCAINNGGCSHDATCTNADSGKTCKCHTGFTGDGYTCTGELLVLIQM